MWNFRKPRKFSISSLPYLSGTVLCLIDIRDGQTCYNDAFGFTYETGLLIYEELIFQIQFPFINWEFKFRICRSSLRVFVRILRMLKILKRITALFHIIPQNYPILSIQFKRQFKWSWKICQITRLNSEKFVELEILFTFKILRRIFWCNKFSG